MSDKQGVAGKSWFLLKRSGSGLGTSRKSLGSGCSKDILRSQGSDFSRAGSGQQNGHLPQQQPQGAEYDSFSSSAQYGTGNGQAASEDGARAQFLEEYDAATLQLCNRLSNANATSVAETTTSKVAPWSCVPGYLGHLTPEQDQALQQMRASFPQSTRWHTDHDILRFLRAREFDVRKTKEMYAKYIREYRGKQMMTPNPLVRPTVGFSMDLVRLYPERSPDLTARMEKMMRWFLHTVALNMDKDSRPVVYFRPGDIFKYNMSKHVPVNDRIAFQSAANESLLILMKIASARAGFNIESITQVLDLQGMSAMQMVSHMRSPDAQREWQHNLDFMPESLHKIFVVNAPSGMSMVWKVASLFTPASTKRKIDVLGANYKSELIRAIGKENMPSCYGGAIDFEWEKHRAIKDLQY